MPICGRTSNKGLTVCGSLKSGQFFRALSGLPQGKVCQFFAPFCCCLQLAGDSEGL